MRQIPVPQPVSKKPSGNTTGRSVSATGPNRSLLLAGRKVEKVRSVRRKIPSRKEACDEVPTLWWIDGA
jgi:hypothetical protein